MSLTDINYWLSILSKKKKDLPSGGQFISYSSKSFDMKKFIISAAVITALFFGPAFINSNAAYCQPEPPNHGAGNNQPVPGGGAPIGEGIVLLAVMGVAYGCRKFAALKTEEYF